MKRIIIILIILILTTLTYAEVNQQKILNTPSHRPLLFGKSFFERPKNINQNTYEMPSVKSKVMTTQSLGTLAIGSTEPNLSTVELEGYGSLEHKTISVTQAVFVLPEFNNHSVLDTPNCYFELALDDQFRLVEFMINYQDLIVSGNSLKTPTINVSDNLLHARFVIRYIDGSVSINSVHFENFVKTSSDDTGIRNIMLSHFFQSKTGRLYISGIKLNNFDNSDVKTVAYYSDDQGKNWLSYEGLAQFGKDKAGFLVFDQDENQHYIFSDFVNGVAGDDLFYAKSVQGQPNVIEKIFTKPHNSYWAIFPDSLIVDSETSPRIIAKIVTWNNNSSSHTENYYALEKRDNTWLVEEIISSNTWSGDFSAFIDSNDKWHFVYGNNDYKYSDGISKYSYYIHHLNNQNNKWQDTIVAANDYNGQLNYFNANCDSSDRLHLLWNADITNSSPLKVSENYLLFNLYASNVSDNSIEVYSLARVSQNILKNAKIEGFVSLQGLQMLCRIFKFDLLCLAKCLCR